MKGNPPVAVLWAVYLVVPLVWKGKCPKVQLYTNTRAVSNGLPGQSRTYKEYAWTVDEQTFGEVAHRLLRLDSGNNNMSSIRTLTQVWL